ncbi:MAG: c-type cytochrome [Saprospiraceae bacterium]|nr:c-type cytochrome [Saprospiraceae bacterium]
MKKTYFLPVFGILLLLGACNKKADFNYYYYEPEEFALLSQYLNLPSLPNDYTVTLPQHLSNTGLFARPVERDKAVLGRVLFYDKTLSKDGKISCASCHKQAIGFSDDVIHSVGVSGKVTDRNSIALASVANFSAYYGTDLNGPAGIRFLWDNRAETIAEQSRGALSNPKEMDMHMNEVVNAVETQPYYPVLFKKAYGDNRVTEDRVMEAIANFINALGSYQSKFDQEASKQPFSTSFTNFSGFTSAENRGLQLYQTNCSSCHSSTMGRPMLFNASNGLDAVTTSDRGVGGVSGNTVEQGTFKVPTLRNIALTGPYMHDGRFATLQEVMEHYSMGIQSHPNLHPNLKASNGQPKRMNFSPTDKDALVAFLNTMTDDKIRTDERFANPFK